MTKRYYSADDIADIKNARGCGVPWDRIAGHYGDSVENIQHACGEPAWKAEPQPESEESDLWSVDRLDGVL